LSLLEHIPDAINLWRPDFRSKSESKVKGMRCSKEELENLFSKIGVDSSSQLIIYDTKGSVDAFRFTWVLDYYEYRNHKVLNGGLVTWKKHGYPTNSDTSTKEIIPTDFRLEAQKEADILASAEEVLHAIDDGNTIIVDTREEYEYLGQPFISSDKIHMYKKGAFAAGAIPTAIHFNWSNLSDLSDDQRIKCKKDLLHDLSNNGITPDKNIIVYCQSGSRSSHTAFVLRNILNYPSVRNYDGSWIEWTYLNQTDNKFGIEQHTSAEEIDEILSKIELKTKKENG